MPTQSNPSPFATDAKMPNTPTNLPTQDQVQQGGFEMRTMKDDLQKIQSGGIIEEKKIEQQPAINPFESKPEAKTFNPETITSQKISSAIEQSPFSTPKVEEKIVEIPTENIQSEKPAVIKIIIAIVFVLVIAIIGLGTYYFLLTKKSQPVSQVPVSEPIDQPTNDIQNVTPIQEEVPAQIQAPKYSEDKPNYLTLDVNNIDSEEIKNILITTSDELKGLDIKTPYEFKVVDINNNPISFPIFATATKINFSPELLNSLGSDFSLYFNNDNGKMRLGLNIEVLNKDVLSKELVKQEKTFITDASFLFLNNPIETKNNPFATSNYGPYMVRFSNTNANKDLSIDYIVTDNRFIFGTSKNTVRTLLDKNESQKKQLPSNEDDQINNLNSTDTKLESNLAQ